MNNLKKIGMTALAASLVSTSAFAGELTAEWFSFSFRKISGLKLTLSRAIING